MYLKPEIITVCLCFEITIEAILLSRDWKIGIPRGVVDFPNNSQNGLLFNLQN